MKPVVDRESCIGCGVCEDTCPEVFRVGDDGIAYVLTDSPGEELYADIRDCVELCPVNAIQITAE
ncbi:MAG: ferredoxin [Coriobacteriales bacterium]|nr:ferredoxin [Actinomycetes bacterium]